MNKIHRSDTQEVGDDLLPEYDFDYKKARSNRFVQRVKPGGRLIVLEPDVAEVFKTPEEVNKLLRALITTMPPYTAQSSEDGSS